MRVKPTINPDTGQPFVIRKPERNYTLLDADGEDVPDNRYWRQHLKDGSVELVKPEKPKKTVGDES